MSTTQTATIQPIPYLSFDGNCVEAMRYYEELFGGKITLLLAAKDTPFADQMPAEFGDKILNARLELPGGGMLYAGDCPPHIPFEGIKGVSLALTFATPEEAKVIFDKLAEGGQTYMPFGPTFWAEGFGMTTDKFGVLWAVNGRLTM